MVYSGSPSLLKNLFNHCLSKWTGCWSRAGRYFCSPDHLRGQEQVIPRPLLTEIIYPFTASEINPPAVRRQKRKKRRRKRSSREHVTRRANIPENIFFPTCNMFGATRGGKLCSACPCDQSARQEFWYRVNQKSDTPALYFKISLGYIYFFNVLKFYLRK